MTIRGSLPEIVRNDHALYEGNLVAYFRAIFTKAQNLQNPYHNFRHMFHVMWMCYQACAYYRDTLSPRDRRNLLIAAMFHDFDHSGMMGNDDLNIERAVRGFRANILPEDAPYAEEIAALIAATEYPYRVPSEELGLMGQIMRDADLAQALSPAWIQQVVFGLAAEWGKAPMDVLRAQEGFHKSLRFHTAWARELFPEAAVNDKIAEAKELRNLLEPVAV